MGDVSRSGWVVAQAEAEGNRSAVNFTVSGLVYRPHSVAIMPLWRVIMMELDAFTPDTLKRMLADLMEADIYPELQESIREELAKLGEDK